MIGGKTKPYDFDARHGSEPVGRVFRHNAGPRSSRWTCRIMVAMWPGIRRDPPCSELVETKDEAVRWLTDCYANATRNADD